MVPRYSYIEYVQDFWWRVRGWAGALASFTVVRNYQNHAGQTRNAKTFQDLSFSKEFSENFPSFFFPENFLLV